MIDPKIQKASDIYVSFMEEVKTRLGVVKQMVDRVRAEPKDPNAFLNAEMAYLQLRYVCELTSLSALAAHSPWGLSDDLSESWNARLAFDDLFKENPLSFPRPAKIVRSDGRIHVEIEDPSALKRRGFQRIYKKCGTALHRGIIKHVMEGKQRQYDISAVDRWATRLGALLSHHAMVIPEKGLALIVNLTSGPEGCVQVAIAMADGPAVYAPPSTETPSPPPSPKPHRPRAKRAKASPRKKGG